MPALIRRRTLSYLLPCILALAVTACSFPGVYRLDVQQGNIVTQSMVNQLKPGMDKRQVRYIMGTPLLMDSFEDDRWDYFYSFKNGKNEYARERLTLYFTDGRLSNLQGNFRPEQSATPDDDANSAEDDLAP